MSFQIKNPREYRILKALSNKIIWRRDLDDIAGANNSPQHIKELRERGLDIPCERVSIIDRDGKKSRPGRYSFTKTDKATIREALKAWENGGVTPSPHASN